jgi:LmbE family N-acetylglucosaminyl deacetylase
MFGNRILIAVPHPDDEVVACCAAIARARAEGAEIFALYLTHGCVARDTLWPWQRKHYDTFVARRRKEAENAAKLLGITPVGWSRRPARHLWRNVRHVDAEIRAAIEKFSIDQLWVPAYEGGNADHDGLNAIGAALLGTLSVLEFAEYNFFERKARSQEFPYPNGTEKILTLTPEERKQKQAALTLYKSEKQNLNYVKIERECFRPLAIANYGLAPHPGKLWYARFQWVPFRHPRVDFTRPDEVSEVIVNFLKSKAE